MTFTARRQHSAAGAPRGVQGEGRPPQSGLARLGHRALCEMAGALHGARWSSRPFESACLVGSTVVRAWGYPRSCARAAFSRRRAQ